MGSRTKKPCPGCREVCPYRSAGDVCGECKRLMKDGELFRTQAKKDRTMEPIVMPWASHSLPYIPHADEMSGMIQDQACAIGRFLGSNAPRELFDHNSKRFISGQESSSIHDDEQCVLLPKGFAEKFEALYATIIAACDHAHRKGVDRGSNILVELVENKMAINEFNERVIREGRKSEAPFKHKKAKAKGRGW